MCIICSSSDKELDMWICPYCRHEFAICCDCAYEVTWNNDDVYCPKCNRRHYDEDNKCAYCEEQLYSYDKTYCSEACRIADESREYDEDCTIVVHSPIEKRKLFEMILDHLPGDQHCNHGGMYAHCCDTYTEIRYDDDYNIYYEANARSQFTNWYENYTISRNFIIHCADNEKLHLNFVYYGNCGGCSRGNAIEPPTVEEITGMIINKRSDSYV